MNIVSRHESSMNIVLQFKDLMYYDCASNLFKKRLMFKYTQSKNTNYHDLTRFDKVEVRKAETRLIYIDCFDLHVFFFNINLLVNSIFTLLQLNRISTLD